jgi:hypothetical protein
MALPKSIQAQVDSANAQLAAINAPAVESPAAPAEQPQPEPVPAAARQLDQQIEPQPEPVAHEPPALSHQPAGEEKTWQARYQALQGLYNHQVPELQKEVIDLKNVLSQTAQRQQTEAVNAPETAAQLPPSNTRDVENFGSDLVEMVQRVTQQTLSHVAGDLVGKANQFERRLAQLEQGLQGTSQVVETEAENRFYSRLEQLVPNWEAINNTQAFKDWLVQVHPIYGKTLDSALKAAAQSYQAERAAAIFNAFTGTSSTPQNRISSAVDRQVTPRSVASPKPQFAEQKRFITQAEIDNFFRRKLKKEFVGREAEAAEAEAFINEAVAENRVT